MDYFQMPPIALATAESARFPSVTGNEALMQSKVHAPTRVSSKAGIAKRVETSRGNPGEPDHLTGEDGKGANFRSISMSVFFFFEKFFFFFDPLLRHSTGNCLRSLSTYTPENSA